MENVAIARLLSDIADLLEIKGENAFRVRAYRNGATTVTDCPERVADLPLERLRELPGIGKDLAARIREAADTGVIGYREELLAEFPPTLLELLGLQGVGPKTVALLHKELGISSLDALEAAARAGRLRTLKGMGAKKEALVLKAVEERRRFAGRHLSADARAVADALVAYLRERAPSAVFDIVGSLRRGVETCGDLDILVTGAEPGVMDAFATYPQVERVLGKGDTKSSVLLSKGYQADLRLVPEDSRGAALQYFTGSKAHNIALRDRALSRGLKLNEYGLFRADGTRVAGATEEEIYAALGLAVVPPELREARGEVEAAERGELPRLVDRRDVRGDVHMHTIETDGRDDVESMARAAQALGYEYIAITEHSQNLAMANGLDETRALAHARQIQDVGRRLDGITILAGIECDILPDGSLDLSDECLSQLDLVIASVHSAFQQDERQMTDRVLSALENPWVDILGHPTGRLLLRREPYRVALEEIVGAAARLGVALEINCQIDRLDLGDTQARLARDRGAKLVVSTDAHSCKALSLMQWGLTVARRAWLTPADVLNTRPVDEFRASLRRHRRRAHRLGGHRGSA
jgi:DNA polymerase (family 10)